MRIAHVLAALLLAACGSIASAADGVDQIPAGKDFPGYSIPKIEKFTLDDKTAGWKAGAGFVIDAMGELAPHPVTDTNAPPSARVAWTDEGLAVFVSVNDNTPHEAENIATMHDGDSVELFVSNTSNPKQHFQVTIGPGTDPALGGKTRVYVHDFRADTSPGGIQVQAVAAKSGTFGYGVTAVLPLAAIGIKPAEGVKLGLQIHVNDKIAGGQMAQYRWRPTYRAARGMEYQNLIVLAKEASPEVLVGINGDYQGYRRLRLRLNANLVTGTHFAAQDENGKELGAFAAQGSGRWVLDLPMPEKAYGPLTILYERKPVTMFTADPPPSRLAGLDAVKTVLKPFAFSGAALPGVEVDDPLAAEDVLGKYALGVRYFDAALNEVKTAEKPGRYLAVVHIASETYKVSDDRIYTLYRTPEAMKSWRDVEMKVSGVEFPKEFGIAPDVSTEQAFISAELFKGLLQQDFGKTQNSAVLLAGLAETKAGGGPMVQRCNPTALAWIFDYALRKKLGILHPYEYLTHLPPDYESKKEEKFPLILFLHGSGERGNKLEIVKTTGFPQYLEGHPEFPAIVVSPQCPFGQIWRPQMVNDLVDEAVAKFRVDPERIYMTGLSMGGYGTWQYAAWYPERLAAIMPVCGIGDAKDMARLKNIPTWVFHGDVDDQVPIGPDKAGVEALKAAGGNVKMTIYPGVGHDSWTQTYNTPEIYTWLLAQRRKAAK